MIGGTGDVETTYDRPVSFGIRRCEFDHYLLHRLDRWFLHARDPAIEPADYQ